MGRAIVRQPQVFLMDEPLSNLDAKLRVQMRADIAKLQRDLGTTTIYVTHDQVEAMTMGDRVAVMNHGVLQQVDAPQRLYDQPANLFVAGFIGTPPMNLLEADVSVDERRVTLAIGGQQLPLADAALRRYPGLRGAARPARRGRHPGRGPPPRARPARPADAHGAARADRGARLGDDRLLPDRRDGDRGRRATDEEADDEPRREGVTADPAEPRRLRPRRVGVRPRVDTDVPIAVDTTALHVFDAGDGCAASLARLLATRRRGRAGRASRPGSAATRAVARRRRRARRSRRSRSRRSRTSLASQRIYFVMPDRYANGDPANDRGGLSGARGVTGYDPADTGWFHGGDLRGLTGGCTDPDAASRGSRTSASPRSG